MIKRYLTEAEQKRLLNAARGATDPRAQRDYWWMRLLVETGARIEEFSLWTAEQAEAALATGWLVVPACQRKGKRHGHEYLVTASVRQCLEALLRLQRAEPAPADLEGPAPLVWGRDGQRLSVRSYQARMEHWREAAGLPMQVTPHWLRHTRGMNLMRRSRSPNALKVVQQALGHTSLASTGIYLSLSREEYAQELRRADRAKLTRKAAKAAAVAGGVAP